MAETLLKIENLTKEYEGQKILDGIHLEVKKGDVLVVVGPSGCGKSTLLRCINALEPIQGGTIKLQGMDIRKGSKNITTLRQKIGMVFQSYELFPHLTVIDNITLAPVKVQKRDKAEKQKNKAKRTRKELKALAEAGDPEAIAERDAMLAKDAEARKRKKKRYAERMANDPEYAEKIRQRQRAYNKAHADKRKADYADLIKRAETDPEAARKLAEIRAYQSRKTVECYQNLVERAKTDPAAAEKLAQKRQKQNESAKAAYNHLKEQAKTDPEAAKKLEERRSKQRKATNKYLEKRKNNVQEDNAA